MKLKQLPWLPTPAEDFRGLVRALRGAASADPQRLRQLATSALNLAQLQLLAKALPAPQAAPGLDWLKVSLLSNTSTDLLAPALAATGPRHNLWLDIEAAPFGAYASEALLADSPTNRRRNDVVVLALDYRAFDFSPCAGAQARAEELAQAALASVTQLSGALLSAGAALVVAQTLAPPPHALFGSLDAQLPGTVRWMIARFNQLLRESTLPGVLLLDVEHLAATVGLDEWHDPIQWNIGKFAFAHDMVPTYAEALCRVIMAAKGKAKKCLVLDLDNTLWGGVIGDDGMTGIVLGQGSPVGEAFLAIQQAALGLRERGIILAVSSKNNEAVAREVFRDHPEMLLREEHIAVFQANWNDKASNLRAIAKTLNIDVSALVFLDDNPAEREQIRTALPEVGVPELPDSPEFFPLMLLAGGYFESVQFTAEDGERAAQYQAESARSVALGATSDMGAYLASLAMVASVARLDAPGRARIVQLINKTNQFNLTTQRYSEAEVAAMEQDDAIFGLQIRLRDRFGDNGMISVVICKRAGEQWLIDTWLMSCRVLNRRLEEQVLNVIVDAARGEGISQLVGTYRPTPKNDLVREHYARLGFTRTADSAEAVTWTLALDGFAPREVPVSIVAGPGVPGFTGTSAP